MKLSFNWLKEYVDIDLTPQELADKLTNAGIEVEEIIPTLPKFNGIKVGEVLEVRKHPNADKLSLCDVKTEDGLLEVICGAPNVAQGQKIPFAGVGTVLPNGIKIKKAKIRGVESVGMICSQEELGMAQHSDGIWELPSDWQIGTDVFEMLKDDQDFIFDLSITPNRPDAMSVVGMAREVAAIMECDYRYIKSEFSESESLAKDIVKVDIENPDGCPRYSARIIKNVKIDQSPEWLAKKLEKSGIRPINNIVDITNFVLLELGQPLHAFDLAQVSDNIIIVRTSKAGEKFVTLDEKERDLPEKTVMICDGEKMVAIGGIMGGLNSEVSDKTIDILLESAYFNPVFIGASSKRLGLSTEASQRFERGIDPNGVIRALDRAAGMMAQLAGGTILKGVIDEYPNEITNTHVKVRPNRINMLLGTKLSEKEIVNIFSRLEIAYAGEQAVVPTFRPDLTREADLIEEVARLITFDKIPVKETTSIEYDTPVNFDDVHIDYLKSQLRELGFSEVITNSMVAGREVSDINDHKKIEILNPISDDMNVMRSSLLPGLLKVASYNINRSMSDLRMYELGRVFISDENTEVGLQPYRVSGLMCGKQLRPMWDAKSLAIDFFDLKGLVESFIDKILLDNHDFILYDKDVFFEPEQVVGLKLNGKIIGHFGKLNQRICEKYDVNLPVFGFEFSVDELKSIDAKRKLFKQFSKYPFVEKDVAFIVDMEVLSGDLEREIYKVGQPLITDIEIFDLYMGDKLGGNKKSIAFRLRFQSADRTLEDKEVNSLFEKIIAHIMKNYPASLRDE
jgi:phenylalanyl-tRNA synthetase beta chain